MDVPETLGEPPPRQGHHREPRERDPARVGPDEERLEPLEEPVVQRVVAPQTLDLGEHERPRPERRRLGEPRREALDEVEEPPRERAPLLHERPREPEQARRRVAAPRVQEELDRVGPEGEPVEPRRVAEAHRVGQQGLQEVQIGVGRLAPRGEHRLLHERARLGARREQLAREVEREGLQIGRAREHRRRAQEVGVPPRGAEGRLDEARAHRLGRRRLHEALELARRLLVALGVEERLREREAVPRLVRVDRHLLAQGLDGIEQGLVRLVAGELAVVLGASRWDPSGPRAPR